MRLDTLLVSRGLVATPDDALRAIMAREVKVADAFATSPATMVAPDADVKVRARSPYVSRGGVKLRGALDAFRQDARGLRCIDVGCSTGGFTDCLLQAGAESVAAVDVGYGDLAWKLRCDERVKVFERTNIRLADPAALGAPFDLIVADLSFIGLAQLAGTFARPTSAASLRTPPCANVPCARSRPRSPMRASPRPAPSSRPSPAAAPATSSTSSAPFTGCYNRCAGTELSCQRSAGFMDW